MKCQDFEKLIIALARQELLEAAVREQSLAHTEVCIRCAARISEERALMAGVRAVVAEIARQEAPARLEATLLAAFREHTTAVASPTIIQMPISTRHWSRRKLTAVAAGILLLVSVITVFWLQSNALNQQRQAQAEWPMPPVAPESPMPSPEPKQAAIETARQVIPSSQRRVRHQASKDRLRDAEVVTEFFPLLEGDDLSSLESGQIVRIELQGSELLAVGLPVDAAMAGEPVKADVVLGHDGLARAIRFVR
jgi:hypothetical protein